MKKFNLITLSLAFLVIYSHMAFAQVEIIDGGANTKYMGADGAGSVLDPYLPTHSNYYTECAKGNVKGCSIVHKFGHNAAVGTSLAVISGGGVYNTPQTTGATTLRIKAGGNANDTAAGTGARQITIEGIDETGALVSETVATAGASASSATTITFMRVFRVWVSSSGTYATTAAGSHAADIVIENGAGGTDWATITLNSFPNSQSEIGVYTVPLGKTAYVLSIAVFIESTKAVNIEFFKRGGVLDTVAPYEAMRVQLSISGGTDDITLRPVVPMKFDALTDFGFMAKVATGTASASVDFEIMLIDN